MIGRIVNFFKKRRANENHDALLSGKVARMAGMQKSLNPFPPKSYKAMLWNKGWNVQDIRMTSL